MQRGHSDHSFDWHGFFFAAKLSLALVVVGTVGHIGLLHAQARMTIASQSTPPAVTQKRTPPVPPENLSTTTPERIIRQLSAEDVVPASGKIIVADLTAMRLMLYNNGTTTASYPILTKGKPGTPWETPSGFYQIQTKEENHLSTIGRVYMPYSMQFYGNYFIHGWPYYAGGEPVASSFSGGCIRLSTEDAGKVFAFADIGTGLFVYDPPREAPLATMTLGATRAPDVSADSYLVADIDSGDVYLDRNAQKPVPIASVSKLVTALVANETIYLEKKVPVRERDMIFKGSAASTTVRKFALNDLLYPLLMQSSNGVADAIAEYYGRGNFVGWMNTLATSLGMHSTHFADPSGLSAENISTSDDLFRLAVYLAEKKSFIWDITRTRAKTLVASDGSSYGIANFNKFIERPDFIGGKIGYTDEADHTMASVFSFNIGSTTRRVAFIVLQSQDEVEDTRRLVAWFDRAVQTSASVRNAACAACTATSSAQYRKIDF